MRLSKVRIISFISTLLVGVDVIQFSGFRLTLLPLLLFGLYIIYKQMVIDKWFIYVVVFAIACLPSIYFSVNQSKSFGYFLWIIFNYISISTVYKYLIVSDKNGALLGVRDSYRLQIIIGTALVLLGFQDRAKVLYYEPSYFALALTPYVVMICGAFIKTNINGVKEFKYASLLDVFLLIIAIYTTKSANLILICLIAAVVVSLFGKGKIKKIVTMIFGLSIALVCLYQYSLYNNDLISVTFQKMVNSTNLFYTAMDRTGNRWPRLQLTYDIAMSTFGGIGIGSFQEYTLTHYLPKFSGMPAYLSPLGNEPMNIYLEIAATSGWIALFVWLLWHYKLIRNANRDKSISQVIICSLVVAMLALMMESNFLRPYYWMLIGMVMGQISLSYIAKNEDKEKEV
ncbi:TPA: O-antigen ligase family protein [Serratia fonticola]